MAHAAARGEGIALLPVRMFAQEIQEKRLMQPFRTEIAAGDYWLTALKSKRQTSGMQSFKTGSSKPAPPNSSLDTHR